MADLSTLDETKPLNTDLTSEGDDRIRETRDAVKTSFGIEHFLTGEHGFPFGNSASRPTAGFPGRIYLNTENSWIEYDTGSTYNQLSSVGLTTAEAAGPLTITGATSTLISTSVTTRVNSKLIIAAVANYNVTTIASAKGYILFWQFCEVDSATTGVVSIATRYMSLPIYDAIGMGSNAGSLLTFWTASGYSAGSHTVRIRNAYINNLNSGDISVANATVATLYILAI